MKSIFSVSFLVCFCSAFCFASDDSYIIEANGDFAKELKGYVKKRSKEDKNLSVHVYKNKGQKDGRFLATGINKNIKYTSEVGKEIYLKNCASCHGVNGEKKPASYVRKLKDMNAEDIAISSVAYASDPTYGSKKRYVMQPISARITSTDVGYIIAYLKGENSYIFSDSSEVENTDIQTTPTDQGTYLK